MGLLNRKKVSSTAMTTEQIVNNVDNRVADGDGDIAGNLNFNLTGAPSVGDIKVTTTDLGAIKAGTNVAIQALDTNLKALDGGYDLASTAIEKNKDVLDDAFGFGRDIADKSLNQVSQISDSADKNVAAALKLAGETQRSEAATALQEFVKYGAIVVAVIGASFVAYKYASK